MARGGMQLSLVLIFLVLQLVEIKNVIAQSIGYHHNMNLGFNPYLSPVFGYGLGLPYGSYTHGPMKNPLLAAKLLGATIGHGDGIMDKLHTKSILKKISPNLLHKGTLMNKLAIMKNPEYLYTPYGVNYGFGKHYGAALVPNNPYKSAYGENYYDMQPAASSSDTRIHSHSVNSAQHPVDPGLDLKYWKIKSILKPLIKAGVFLATASLLSKKTVDIPSRLNPSGMILSGERIASQKIHETLGDP